MAAPMRREWAEEFYVQEQPQREEQLPVAPKKIVNHSLRNQCLVVVAFLLLIGMISTIGSAYVSETGYRIVKMKMQTATLEKQNEQLKVDIAQLKSHQRIETIALNQLGMVVPSQVLYSEKVYSAPDIQVKKEEQTPVLAQVQKP